MQKNMFLNVAAVAALTLLGGCGSSSEEVKPVQEQDMAAAAPVQENVQVAENDAMPPADMDEAAPEASAEEAAPVEEPAEEKA